MELLQDIVGHSLQAELLALLLKLHIPSLQGYFVHSIFASFLLVIRQIVAGIKPHAQSAQQF